MGFCDEREIQLPETIYEQDVELRALRSIILKSLMSISGVHLLEENLMDTLLGRDNVEGVRGIEVQKDENQPSISVFIKVKVSSDLNIPHKVEEIQTEVCRSLVEATGMHISKIAVNVCDVVLPQPMRDRLSKRMIESSSYESEEEDKDV